MTEIGWGDVVVLADRAGRYTGKPRPALVVQADLFPGTDSLVVCLITSVERNAPLLRVALPANKQTGLQQSSWIQIEKITAVSCNQIGRRIGTAGATVMLEVIRCLAVLLRIG
jgi:mRNA interferase MazF